MSKFIHLVGSEAVQNAGSTMRQAATEITMAALNIQAAFEQHQRFMDDWLERFREVMLKAKE